MEIQDIIKRIENCSYYTISFSDFEKEELEKIDSFMKEQSFELGDYNFIIVFIIYYKNKKITIEFDKKAKYKWVVWFGFDYKKIKKVVYRKLNFKKFKKDFRELIEEIKVRIDDLLAEENKFKANIEKVKNFFKEKGFKELHKIGNYHYNTYGKFTFYKDYNKDKSIELDIFINTNKIEINRISLNTFKTFSFEEIKKIDEILRGDKNV